MRRIAMLAAAASVALTAAAAPPKVMGGLPLTVAHGGPFDGLVDTSPLARSEVELRADPRTLSVRIVPAGWVLTVKPQTLVPVYLNEACAILVKHGIPRSVMVTVAAGSAAAASRTCATSR